MGEAEVGEHRVPVLIQQNIRGLDIAMDDAFPVRVFQGPRHLCHKAPDLIETQTIVIDPIL